MDKPAMTTYIPSHSPTDRPTWHMILVYIEIPRENFCCLGKMTRKVKNHRIAWYSQTLTCPAVIKVEEPSLLEIDQS